MLVHIFFTHALNDVLSRQLMNMKTHMFSYLLIGVTKTK